MLSIGGSVDNKSYLLATQRTDLSNAEYNDKASLGVDGDVLQMLHAALGMAGEVGEVIELVKKQLMYDKAFTKDAMVKELGDVLWYMSVMLRNIDSNFDEVMQTNIDKLKARYPDKFSKEAAVARADIGSKLRIGDEIIMLQSDAHGTDEAKGTVLTVTDVYGGGFSTTTTKHTFDWGFHATVGRGTDWQLLEKS